MADFLSVLECIATGKDAENGVENGTSPPATDVSVVKEKEEELVEISETELEEQVNDLIEIRKKDILKRNLLNILRENLTLKQKVKQLEAKLEDGGGGCAAANSSLTFQIDTDGGDGDCGVTGGGILYTEHAEILTDSIPEKVEEKEKLRPANTCFNCLGDHMIADCTEPRDPRAIARNRKEFQSKSSNTARYHVDEPQKFGHLKPGLPSTKLREALRLRDRQVPEYIYRMRLLGYPPGWMKHAEISSSGISLYHDKGQKLNEDGEEDGEVKETSDTVEYDIEKLMEWPGFNAQLPKDFKDDTERYRVPPLSRCKMLEDMKAELKSKEQKAYTRGKMQDVSTLNSTIDLTSDVEMDEEPGAPGVEEEEEKNGGDKVPPSEEENSTTTSSTGFKTPSMSRSQSIGSSSGSVSKTEPGTPIVEMFSPFAKLPQYDNFGKDMTEHILFDNLPNYTGTWEQMSGLISRIRKRKEVAEEKQDF